MKKFILSTLAAVALVFVAASCTSVTPGYGMLGTGAVNPDVSMVKTGEATGKFLFGVLGLDGADCSVSTAAKNGGIKKIATVDTKTKFLFILTEKTTIVTGE